MTPARDSSRKQKSAQVKIRKAKPSDKSPVLEISKKIWSGHDYLPQIWDDWLADKNARLIVATVNRRTVGVAHASLQTHTLHGSKASESTNNTAVSASLES